MESIKCYTDASYSQDINTSIIAYKIGNDDIITKECKDIKNTEAELYAITECIKYCELNHPNKTIIIFTDCQKALQNKYADNVTLIKVKGHKKKVLMNSDELIFKTVDQTARKKLRQLVSSINLKNMMTN